MNFATWVAILATTLFLISSLIQHLLLHKWKLSIKHVRLLTLVDVVWRSPKGVSLAISEIGIQFRLPSSFSNPAFIVFRITNPTVTIHQNNSNNSGDNVEGTSSRPLPSKGSSSGTPAAAAVKKGSKGGVAGTSSPLTSILSSPLILFSLRLLKLRIVRFTLKCLFYLEVRGLRVNFIVDTDTSAATIQYTHSLFTLKLGNSVKSSLSLESFEQGRKNFGLVLGISPFEVDLVEIKDAASPPTRRRLLKSDQESSLCLSINLDISKGKVWKPSLLVDVCGVVLYLGEMLKAVEMLKSFSICQKQQHPHILEQGIQSDSNFAGMSDDRRRNAPSKSASNINASSSCTSATSVATEEQIIPMLNEIFEKIMAGIKDICFFQPLVFVSITKTVIISSNLVDSIQDSTYFQCSIGEISISSAILDSQSQAKLLESWQGDVLMEWEDSDPVVDVNVCIKTFQVDMIESKTSVSTVFNILSVPRNGFRFNMQLVDTLDPGLDPNLQSKDEPRMGVHFAVGVALDDAFVLLEENVLQSVVQIISSFLSNQQLQQNSASSESSHYNASSSSSPRSILTRHQHLVLSILSKSFVAFSLECYVKQPGVIVRLNNIINTPLGVYTKDIQTSNVDLKFGIGSCKLSFWNVFGGIPDGFAFPLKYDMQCRYLYVHAEKSILKTLSAVEKEFEDIIEEPEWLLACNGDIVVGRSLILQETSSRANSSDMIDLLASNALTGGDSNIRDSGGIYSSNNATIAAYHRLALAINTNIFVGELAINCSRLSFSLISINYASVFEKIGTCLKQLQQLQKVSPHKRRFVKTKYDVSSESAVLPMDINFSLAVDITKFLVGFSGQDGLNGIAFSIDNASLRAHSIIEAQLSKDESGDSSKIMKQSLSSIVSKLVETREQQQDESDGSNQCGRPSKANNPRLSRSFKLLSRRSSSADSLAGDVLCLSSSSRASDTAPSIGKPNDPSGIESSVKFNSKSQVSLELSLSGTVIETIVESDAKSSSAAATAAGPSSSPIIEQILRIGTIDVSFCSKSDKYTSSTERNSVVSLDFVKESLRPAGNVKNTVSQALQEIVDIKIRDVKILFSVPTLVIIIRSVAQLKRLAVCFKDGVNVSATILSSSSSSDKIASSAEVASASEPYDQALLGEAGSLPPPVKPKASQIKVKVFINKIDVDVRLPFGVALRAVVKNSKIDLAIAAEFDEQRESRQAQIEFESVLVTVPVKTNTVSAPLAFTRTPNESDIIKWENLVLIQTLRTSIIKKSNQRENGTFWLQNCFHVSSSSFLFTIPYAFEMANVVEAAVATNKTLRIILNKHLQIPLSQIPDSGHTVVNHEKIPILKLEVHSLCVKFYDDPFESYLSRNWKLGCEEQIGRIARDKAFQRKVNLLRTAATRKTGMVKLENNTDDSNIENSWWLLQEYNSSSWIGRLGKHAAGDHSEAPALLTVNFHALSIIISSPNLLADTVERTLHLMEPDSTPSDRKYDELIPRTISIEFDGLSAKLRDYSYPFLLVPKSVASESAVARKSWKCQGLVVIAEQIATDASKRAVLVPMDPLPYKPVNLFKTINPIKFYTSMKISIHVPPGESARLSWGANIDPAINDMARVIDSFTKPNVDPSPIIGWWDKLRLILHGKTEIVIGGEGDFRFSILGSHNPYRRKLGSSGSSQMALFRVDSRFSEGVEMVLSKGARIAVGGGDSKYSSAEINHQIRIPELITIETGLLMFSMPKAADLVDADSKHESSESSNSMDYVVAKLIGGVRIGLGIKFIAADSSISQHSLSGDIDELEVIEFWPKKTHCDIVLSTPDYVEKLKRVSSSSRLSRSNRHEYDAFRGFRTNTMHLDINIVSPPPFYFSLVNPMNFLNLSSSTYTLVRGMSALYQSPMMNIPIHRGKIYTVGPVPKKPKLSRAMGSLHLKVNMLPLVLGLFEELEEDNQSGVGMRCKAERMDIDMKFVQNVVKSKKAQSESPEQEIQHMATRWSLEASEISFSELEGRAISFGNALQKLKEKSPSLASDLDSLGGSSDEDELSFFLEEGLHEWVVEEDLRYLDSVSQIKMIPFLWSPKMTISKRRDEDTNFSLEKSVRSETDVYNVQAVLYKKRLHEINASIKHYLEVQKGLEYRIAVFYDESKRQLSDIVVEKLASLYEKRNAIEKYIRKCERPKAAKLANLARKQSTVNSMTGGASKTSFFNYFYIIHNINLLWKRDVRNILFKFFELQSKDFAVKYYLTNAANRIVKDLVAAVSEKGAGSGIDEYDDPAGKSTEQKGTTILFDSNMAKRLLKQLIAEREDNFYVSNESEFDEEAEEATQLYGRDRFLIQNRTYIPSSERSSPDYVPPGFFADSQYLIVLVKPQINLESDADGDQKVQPQAVVVAAEEMEFQKINIADQLAFSNLMGDTDGDEAVAKTRQILNIRSAQFYVARKSDVEKAVESDLDSILISNKAAEKGSVKEAPWPLWVPAECLIEHDYPLQTGHLQKVMEKTEANLVRDLANPIYVSSQASNNADGGPQEEEDHRTVVRSKHINERAHVIYVNFPTFEITANSLQHSIFFNVVINLLVYNDPARGERNDRLRKMTLALEQMEDIYAVIESVNTLQDKIRQTESLLAYQMQNSRKTATPTGFKSQLTDIRQAGIRYKDELYVLMEALKQLLNLSRTKNSVEVAWQLNVQAGKLVWTMMLDDGEPVCRWEFDKSSYEYIHNEDQSSANTLEIDKLHVENLLPPPQLYKDLINAYIADKRIVDFKKQKMLRVYWREQAPVAGIAVVNHFEIKLFPLQFQMNYEIGKLLAYYIFPEKKKKVESTGSSSGSAVGGKASTDDAKSSGKGSSLASDASYTSSSTAATSAANTIGLKGKKAYAPSESQDDALVQMQTRASKNKTFIYVKVPGVPLCLSYRGSKEKNLEDLNMFVFKMPTLEYRNNTWSWLDFLNQIKRDAIRAALANTASLLKEKIFHSKKDIDGGSDRALALSTQAVPVSAIVGLNMINLSYSLRSSKQQPQLQLQQQLDGRSLTSLSSVISSTQSSADTQDSSSTGRSKQSSNSKLFGRFKRQPKQPAAPASSLRSDNSSVATNSSKTALFESAIDTRNIQEYPIEDDESLSP